MLNKPDNTEKNTNRKGQRITVFAVIFVLCIGGIVFILKEFAFSDVKVISLAHETLGNPIVGGISDLRYGGDPSVLVDGEVAYLYTGVDASTDKEVASSVYNIPQYVCYSSTDLVNWQDEGIVMDMQDVKWASNDTSAWAAQVMKHYDNNAGKDMYYLYFCTWDKTGKQSIGVAVSDSPTGKFVDIGEPLVKSSVTKPNTSSFNDIDPTAWIETDEEGVEHRYLAWGNGMFFVCELNEDMVSVSDVNGDGKITSGMNYGEDDVVVRTKGLDSYTEAPWLYRRQDASGDYVGPYYLFFAHQWRECMAYATTDDLLSGDWSKTNLIMYPTSTSNTNHMAVFDFKGHTYFVYHNGSLAAGSGYRRCPCIVELNFNEDGSIDLMEESAIGLAGAGVNIISAAGEVVSHEPYVNSLADADYPYKNVKVGIFDDASELDATWVIRQGKSDAANENYVSIESENKPGLFITTKDKETIVLAQDTDAKDDTAMRQTFVTVEGLSDKSKVSFESVAYPGMYLALVNGELTLTEGKDKDSSTFVVQ